MDVKRAIKKLVALGTGATMLGATVMGAMAADLSDFPAPFVENGVMNSLLVIGRNAQPIDNIAVTNVATSLQAAAVTPTVGGGATTAITFGEGVLIEAPGDDLNYGEDINTIDAGFDEEDLPVVLAEGTLSESEGENENEESYEQDLVITAGTATAVFDADSEADDEKTDTYIFLDESVVTYTYDLEFDDGLTYDTDTAATAAEDFETATIEIQGQEYTISDVETVANGVAVGGTACAAGAGDVCVSGLTLLAGTVEATQGEYTTASYGPIDDVMYEVEVVIVADDALEAKFKVNGETTKAMAEGETTKLSDGTRLAVKEVLPNEGTEAVGADQVTFYLGADELVLNDGNEVEKNGADVDGADVTVNLDSDAIALDGFTVDYTVDDDVYIGAGDEWEDPVFGRFKLSMSGVVSSTEEIDLTASGDDAELKLINIDGDELEIPFVLDTTVANQGVTYPGDDLVGADVYTDQDGQGLTEDGGNLLIADGDTCGVDVDTTAITACEGILLLVVGSGGEARIIEITDISAGASLVDDAGTVDLKDHTTGKTWDDEDYSATIDLGFADIEIDENALADIDGDAGADDPSIDVDIVDGYAGGDSGAALFETEKLAEVMIGFDGTDSEVRIYEGDTGADLMGGAVDIQDDDAATAGGDAEIDVSAMTVTWNPQEEDSDIDKALDIANWGAIFTYDSENNDDLNLMYNEEEAIIEVYLVPAEARGVTRISSTGTVNPINVDATVFDDEVSSLAAQNSIIVGGPCVNSLAAEFMGNPADCTEGFEEGKAVIKLKDVDGNVAMLVAGYSGEDTRLAGKVVAQYADYADKLTGMEVEVSGTSLSNVEIGVPTE